MKTSCCTPRPTYLSTKDTLPARSKYSVHLPTIASSNVIRFIRSELWTEGLFGLEKENLRADLNGHLALTPHPSIFGNKLKHPYITTDFSESQIELRTPPLPDIRETLGFIETLHDIVSLELKDEYLWPQSIPPILPDENLIPIANYDNEGLDARKYREVLARKYGSKNQLFSGIHFNISFGDKLLHSLYVQTNSSLSFEAFKDEVYLKTLRQLLRLRWIYILLFGNSPVVDPTMELRCKRPPYKIDKHVIALSIRNSCYGYQNLDPLYPDYNSVEGFKKSIEAMITEGLIASSRELYSAVRPKFNGNQQHISYLELRFIDIDPLSKTGMTAEQLYFLHVLAIYGLLNREPDEMDIFAQRRADHYHGNIALYGLQNSNFPDVNKEFPIHFWDEAKEHVLSMQKMLDELSISQPEYHESIKHAIQLIEKPEKRRVFETMQGILNVGYVPFHLNQAKQFLIDSKKKDYNFYGFQDLELSTQLLLREAIKRGINFEIINRKENFIQFEKDGNIQWVKQATKTSLDNYASILAMEDKLVTKKILHQSRIRVPKGSSYTNAESAKADFPEFKSKEIVIKPNQTNFGIGITILRNNQSEDVFKRAIDIAFEHDNTILIEEFIEGREFRFFVIGKEVVGILHRVPANVTGNGESTIRELVQIKNQDPLRGKGYRTPLEKIQLGEAEEIYLKAQNMNFESIPAKDQVVFLRENSNISTGGDSIDYTDSIPDSYKKIALRASEALKVNITGLDMVIQDYTQEAREDNYAIIEMNFNPAIHIHCHPFKGENRKIYEKLMNAMGY